LNAGIKCFNIESEDELIKINSIAGKLGKIAKVSLRVNPDVDAKTHPYISTGLKENKFGVSIENALDIYLQAPKLQNIKFVGIGCHIGSQLLSIDPFVDAVKRLIPLIRTFFFFFFFFSFLLFELILIEIFFFFYKS